MAEALPTTAEVVASLGTVFVVFDRTQDSGHVSYGVRTADGRRLFLKTPGRPEPSPAGTSRVDRTESLRRTARLQRAVDHPALVPLPEVVEASDGVVLVYEWFDGDLLGSPAARRQDPAEAHHR